MPPRIRVLDEALANQIAAGEVIERPASAVKELIENALDAGATRVHVEISAGGAELLRVSDDGSGMGPEDAVLALRRHATSKLRSAADLTRLATLGFRGEALPSLASVSRFRMVTRTADAEAGTEVRVEGGGTPTVTAAGAPTGTTIEARDLFWNVPARLKFMKGRAAEAAQVTETCVRAAMTAPRVHFTLVRDGRRVLDLPATDVPERRVAAALHGDTLLAFDGERDDVAVHAFLSPPEAARASSTGLHLFVNGRPVRDRALTRAVSFAYGSVMPPGRFPTGAVFLSLPLDAVDVNVHPQKAEVRFASPQRVYGAVGRVLAARLATAAWSLGVGPLPRPAQGGTGEAADARTHALAPAAFERIGEPAPDPWGLTAAISGAASVGSAMPASLALGSARRFRVLGQAHRMFIVCEGDDGVYFFDQHAADERVRFERLRAAFAARRVETQPLLFPERVDLEAEDLAWIDASGALLADLGFEVASLGDRTAAIRAVPALLARAAPGRLLRDLLDERARAEARLFGDRVDTVLATMACHGAIRAGDALSLEECEALVTAVDALPFGEHCPHGRPIAHVIHRAELERAVGR